MAQPPPPPRKDAQQPQPASAAAIHNRIALSTSGRHSAVLKLLGRAQNKGPTATTSSKPRTAGRTTRSPHNGDDDDDDRTARAALLAAGIEHEGLGHAHTKKPTTTTPSAADKKLRTRLLGRGGGKDDAKKRKASRAGNDDGSSSDDEPGRSGLGRRKKVKAVGKAGEDERQEEGETGGPLREAPNPPPMLRSTSAGAGKGQRWQGSDCESVMEAGKNHGQDKEGEEEEGVGRDANVGGGDTQPKGGVLEGTPSRKKKKNNKRKEKHKAGSARAEP